MNVAALVPAYNPSDVLVSIVVELVEKGMSHVVVVDDGSSPSREPIFDRIAGMENVTLLRHAVNRGKGAALKTGMNHIYCMSDRPSGVVTVDADGQHLATDAIRIGSHLAENPGSIILGVRNLTRNIPLRSYIGNALTRFLYRTLIGQNISDTQTGLRGIPVRYIPRLLKIESDGYEFELDMLLMCKHSKIRIVQCPITTLYENDNAGSHFNPIRDSMRIYFVLLRFSFASLSTTTIDYLVFWTVYQSQSMKSVALCTVMARIFAVAYNYLLVKRYIFYSDQKHSTTFPRYLLLVIVSGAASVGLINGFMSVLGLHVLAAKVIAESGIFIVNFLVQRDLIFTRTSFAEETVEGLVAAEVPSNAKGHVSAIAE